MTERTYKTTLFEPDGYRSPEHRPEPACKRCHGDGLVCSACALPADECQCWGSALPTPKACPDCGGKDDPPPKASRLVRLHWWCLAQAAKHDRPGYSLVAFAFDWVGGRAAELHRRRR
jgi:hypothetical protein